MLSGIVNAAGYGVSYCCKGTLLSLAEFLVCFTTKLLSSGLQLVLLDVVMLPLEFVASFCLFSRPVEIPLKGRRALQYVDHSLQLGIVHRRAEGVFHPIHS